MVVTTCIDNQNVITSTGLPYEFEKTGLPCMHLIAKY